MCPHTVSQGAVRIALRSGSARNGTTTSERPSAMRSTHFSCHFVSPPASTFTLPLDLTTSARQTANKSLSIPLSQPPAFPFSLYLFFSFSCTLGNDDRLLAQQHGTSTPQNIPQ